MREHNRHINEIISSTTDITFGVPQGSIISPVLFNIFVNDMPTNIKDSILIQYADDKQLLQNETITNLSEIIKKTEKTIKNTHTYYQENGLMLNIKKTQCIFIGSHHTISQIPNHCNILRQRQNNTLHTRQKTLPLL